MKQTKPALSFYVRENRFYNRQVDWLVSPPEVGFLFPAFDDRSTNLYDALYYNRDVGRTTRILPRRCFPAPSPCPLRLKRRPFRPFWGDAGGGVQL